VVPRLVYFIDEGARTMDVLTTVAQQFKEQLGWHKARTDMLAKLVLALIRVTTVNLVKLSTAIDGKATLDSKYRKIQRFFSNFDMDVEQIAKFLVSLFPINDFPWPLAIDRTNWKFGQKNINILMIVIAYKGIGIPVVWIFLDKRGNSNTAERIALTKRFIAIFGKDKIECLLGDREFIGKVWFDYLKSEEILFRLRIKKNNLVANAKGSLVHAKNLFRNLPRGHYRVLPSKRSLWGHQLHIIGAKLDDGRLLIIATQEHPDAAIDDYKKRWQIETLFSCLKSRGYCFESTHMTEGNKIERLVAVLAIAFCWAHLVGEWMHERKPIKLKAHGRRAHSLFGYGLKHLMSVVFDLHSRLDEFSAMLQLLFPHRLVPAAVVASAAGTGVR
jgi:hypothetical protein